MTATLAPVANHPNRSTRSKLSCRAPTPDEVKAARERAGLTQTECAEKVRGSLRSWQNHEADARSNEHRPMHPGLFELFLIKTGQPVPAWMKDSGD